MILSPIRKVLSLIAAYEVRALLMGGQACILYGGAEFSRDIDFAILASDENLVQLKKCLGELEAEVIAVPPFDKDYLERGHAIHFRCRAPEALGLRVDVMTKLRGVDDFEGLWDRRNTICSDDGSEYQVLSLPDLVKAKKTQRDKDWPMIRRLIEADYFAGRDQPTREQIEFWLLELRTPELLIEVASANMEVASALTDARPLLRSALLNDELRLVAELAVEEEAERQIDREYWLPLKAELEQCGANGSEAKLRSYPNRSMPRDTKQKKCLHAPRCLDNIRRVGVCDSKTDGHDNSSIQDEYSGNGYRRNVGGGQRTFCGGVWRAAF